MRTRPRLLVFVLCLSCLLGGRPVPAGLTRPRHPDAPARGKFVPLAVQWRQRIAWSIATAHRLRPSWQTPRPTDVARARRARLPRPVAWSLEPALRLHLLKTLLC